MKEKKHRLTNKSKDRITSIVVALIESIAISLSAIFGIPAILEANQIQQTTVIEPREGDIIITDKNGNYKLVQLLTSSDFYFEKTEKDEIILYEGRIENIKYTDTEINNIIKIDNLNYAFSYSLDNLEINSGKIMNLQDILLSIDIIFEYYTSDNISDQNRLLDENNNIIFFEKRIYNKEDNESLISFNNLKTDRFYMKKFGIDFIKIKFKIVYTIDNKIFNSELSMNSWCHIEEQY